MKKNTALIIAAAMLAAALSGCSLFKTNAPDETNDKPWTEIEVETAAPVTEISAPAVQSKKGITTMDEMFGMFSYADKSTGYIADTAPEIDTALVNSGKMYVKELSAQNIVDDIANGNDDATLYKFTMYNSSPAELVGDDTSGTYISRITLDETDFTVIFGTAGTTTSEEVSAYSSEGTTWEYWAFAAMNKAGTYILTPIIAGSEETGYWAVRPVLILAKFDVSGMQMIWDASAGATPAETIPVVTTVPAVTKAPIVTTTPEKTKAPTESSNSANVDDYGVYMHVSSAKNFDDHVQGEFSFTNYYPCEVWLSEVTATLNGVDVTSQFTTYISAEANSTSYDDFYIDNAMLKKGDTLVISGMLINLDTGDDMGEISLPLTFE